MGNGSVLVKQQRGTQSLPKGERKTAKDLVQACMQSGPRDPMEAAVHGVRHPRVSFASDESRLRMDSMALYMFSMHLLSGQPRSGCAYSDAAVLATRAVLTASFVTSATFAHNAPRRVVQCCMLLRSSMLVQVEPRMADLWVHSSGGGQRCILIVSFCIMYSCIRGIPVGITGSACQCCVL